MTTKVVTVAATEPSGRAPDDRPGWSPGRSDPSAASAALALATALLRALKDRGVLAADELEDVLAETGGRLVNDPTALRLLNAARGDLERKDEGWARIPGALRAVAWPFPFM